MSPTSTEFLVELSSSEFASLAANLGIGTWYFSPPKGTISLDSVAARLFNLDSADIYPVAQLLELTTLGDNEHITQFEQWIYNPTMQTEFFLRLKHGGGHLKTLLMRASPLRSHHESSSLHDAIGGIVCDLSSLRSQLTQERETHRLDSLSRLAGGVAHEFNNMLTVIIGSTNLALDLQPPEHPTNTSLLAIRNAAERCVLLTEQLLTFARRQSSHMRHNDLNEAIRLAIPSLRELLPSEVVLDLQLEGSLPVFIDLSQLHLILMQAAANARDAMPTGGLFRVRTSLLRTRLKAHARLELTDSGEGMPSEVLHRALDPFFSTKSPREGSGLGLSIIYGIARKHQAALSIDSQPHKGTTLTIDFPLASVATRRSPTSLLPVTSQTAILLLTHEPRESAVMSKVLSQLGHEVVHARDDVEALALASSNHLLLFVAEHRDTVDLTQLITVLRIQHPELPALLLESGTAPPLDLPYLHHLPHPSPPHVLLNAAQHLLRQS